MKYTLTYKIVSDEKNGLGYVITTAGGPNSTSNKFIPIVDLSYDGKPTLNPVEDLYNPFDLEQDRIGRWRHTSENPNTISIVERPKFTGLTVSRHERLADIVFGKYVTDIVDYEGPINEVGKNLSRAETIRQDLNKYSNSKEGIELALEKSKDCEDIAYIGVTSIGGVIYSIQRLKDGRVRLSIGTKAYEYLSREAENFGLTLEDIIVAKLGEEAMHHYRRSYDKRFTSSIKEERATKQALLEFYERLAEGAESNPRLREKYMKIIRSIKHDIETVRRYRRKSHENDEEAAKEESDLEKAVEEENNEGGENKTEVAENNNKYSKRENSEEAQEQECSREEAGANESAE